MENLYQRIYDEVRKVPSGQVASYGQIARMVGMPRGAQVVGWALKALGDSIARQQTNIPWQRIVNKAGRISIKNPKVQPSEQAELLKADGNTLAVDEQGFLLVAPHWFVSDHTPPQT